MVLHRPPTNPSQFKTVSEFLDNCALPRQHMRTMKKPATAAAVAAVMAVIVIALAMPTAEARFFGGSHPLHHNDFFRQQFGGRDPFAQLHGLDPWNNRFAKPMWRNQQDRAAEEQAAALEQAAREQAAREQAAREQAAREQAAREQAAREQAAREQAAREQAAREQAAREQAAREQAAQEAASRQRREHEDAIRAAAVRARAARGARDATMTFDDRYELVVQPRRDLWGRVVPFSVRYSRQGDSVLVKERAFRGFSEEYIIPDDVNPRAVTTHTGPNGELVVVFPRTKPVEEQPSKHEATNEAVEPQQRHEDSECTAVPSLAHQRQHANRAHTPSAATQAQRTRQPARGHAAQEELQAQERRRREAEEAAQEAERKAKQERRERKYREWLHRQHLEEARREAAAERRAAKRRSEAQRAAEQRMDERRASGSDQQSNSGRLRRRHRMTETVTEEFGNHDDTDDSLVVEDVPVDDDVADYAGEAVPEAARGYYARGEFVEY